MGEPLVTHVDPAVELLAHAFDADLLETALLVQCLAAEVPRMGRRVRLRDVAASLTVKEI
jgi:hypothetical protein